MSDSVRTARRAGLGGRGAGVAVGVVGLVASLGLAGCTGDGGDPEGSAPPAVEVGDLTLAAFSSCDDALAEFRRNAGAVVGPYGFTGGRASTTVEEDAERRDGVDAPAAAPNAGSGRGSAGGSAPGDTGAAAPAPDHSSTTVHETGVDEPDLVKTDGRRIVVVGDGVLRVVDARDHRVTGTLALPTGPGVGPGAADLLLSGDRALVLTNAGRYDTGRTLPAAPVAPVPPPAPDLPGATSGPGAPRGSGGSGSPGSPGSPAAPVAPATAPATPPTDPPTDPTDPIGPRLILVDLGAPGAERGPTVAGTLRVDGFYVDARQVGSVARVVVRSGPRIAFPDLPAEQDTHRRIQANRAAVDRSTIDQWLPRYRLEAGGQVTRGQVGCDRVSRPATFSGTAMLTVLTVDLAGPLGTGDPVTVAADGDTVYGTGTSLYVANDRRYSVPVDTKDGDLPEPVTELYKFDTSTPGRPRYVAAGAVRGWLLNQYSMSEFDGHLRVATTFGGPGSGGARSSQSGVAVLRQRGDALVQVGAVGGLGRGEQIFAVRFIGPVGYVVTFRQTDPLYTLDLRTPSAPKVVGDLKITGYSAYLHPAGDGRLIGVGQEATEQGVRTGTQVSLFDVADPAGATRIARYQVEGAHSEAEADPHAFLYWERTRTLVIPLSSYGKAVSAGPDGSVSDTGGTEGALVLRLEGSGGDARLVEVGSVEHGARAGSPYPVPIRRALVVDQTLWTVSDAGLMASDLATLRQLAWVGF